jgi:ssDNA thymidine ADP-ribosyltransferase, DarT
MIERKPDAARIEAHLESLKASSWIGPARHWWPNFVFFFADLPNALRIFDAGKLLCRNQAAMAVDTGSEAVLDLTADQWKNCVRLYFRPRTPTQYQIEGFRPPGQHGSLGKHMPVPIFFLFDSKDILTRRTTRFSQGNLSQNPPVGDDATFFESIPFERVYHDSWMREEEKSNIKFHRHAEIIIPGELDLGPLRRIWCRSDAEYQMLLRLLSPPVMRKYKGIIGQGKRPSMHFCKWTFVESVVLEINRMVFTFNQSTVTPGPFAARIEVTNLKTSARYKWENATFEASKPLTISIPQITEPVAYEVQFLLENVIGYAGTFNPKETPF